MADKPLGAELNQFGGCSTFRQPGDLEASAVRHELRFSRLTVRCREFTL